MTDEHENQEASHDVPEGEASEQAFTPPATLTPPQASTSSPPVLALVAGLGIAVACGIGLWVSSQLFYVYIFYNVLVGNALGWAVGLGPRKSGFANVPALTAGAVLLSVLPYVVMRYAFFVQYLPDFQQQGFDPTFLQFFQILLENDTLFGIELGLWGNLVVLLVEIGITVSVARGAIMGAIQRARIESVPADVVSFVVQALAHGWDTATLKRELAQRGWTRADDQDRAIGTGFDVIAALQAQQQA